MPITRRRRANPPDQSEGNNHRANQPNKSAETLRSEHAPARGEDKASSEARRGENNSPLPSAEVPMAHRDRYEQQTYTPSIESGRRTARGELFRRPPQVPALRHPTQTPATAVSPPLQPPSHEISLPLEGNLLHLAYNPGYTEARKIRTTLLHHLVQESKAGGRARCWNCGSIAILYECWSTGNNTFGEIGIAFCEICGVWSVM